MTNFRDRPYRNSNLFTGHYLDERIKDREEWDCDEEARDVMETLRSKYELESDLVATYNEDGLIDNWIDEVLETLGFGTQQEVTLPDTDGYVDELLFESPDARRDAQHVFLQTEDSTDVFERSAGILEAKQWGASFSKKFSESRQYRNASHQIKHYLEKTPSNVQWGILTNGKKWRLYGTEDYETETYYEIDLPGLLEEGNVEQFKYFYVFFRPEAFHEIAGATFLDEVRLESEIAAQELGENLQNNVFTALRVLGRGFVETNDLSIDPSDDETLDKLKNQSLVFLYRLMFVLYAEGRGMIHPEGQQAVTEYEENFSLNKLRSEIHETIGETDEGFDKEYSEYATSMWGRLDDLFELIDEGKESLGIPPYNGGLFDREQHEFLTNHEVSDRYLSEVIYRLSTTENDEGRYVLADYGDLDTRHLGSVYEGLLEHQFRIAPEEYAAVAEGGSQVWKPATEVSVAEAIESVPEGGLYVVNDDGERRATGSYYTPDYVVTYIVEETVEPLIEDIRENLIEQGFEPGTQEYLGAFLRRVTDLQILDPAMGSGHFLTNATGYLAEQVMAEVREVEEELGVQFDEEHVRRGIAKECIYGVDVNGMAVELAKLSMWLQTLAADRPLAFLDHHFKHGNSLVGSDIETVLNNGESDDATDEGQLTLQESFDRTRRKALEHVTDQFKDLFAIDNESLDDIKEMEAVYEKVQSDPLYQRLIAMANVHTADQFGLDVPNDANRRMAEALRDDSWGEIEECDWYRSAQAMADERHYFHWELEFPVVFYQQDGERRDDSGFDAIIGNPPWVDVKGLDEPQLLFELFDTSFNRVNIYTAFVERSSYLLRPGANFGFITPNSYLTQISYRPLREHLLDNYKLENIVRLPDDIFDGVTMETAILTAQYRPQYSNDEVGTIIFPRDANISEITREKGDYHICNVDWWKEQEDIIFDIFTNAEERSVIQRIEDQEMKMADMFESCLGLTPYDKYEGHSEEIIENRGFHADKKKSEDYHRITTGEGISRYNLTWKGGEWIKYGDWLGAPREERFFTEPRCVVRQIVSVEGRGIYAAYSDQKIFHTQVGFVLLPKDQSNREAQAKALTGLLNSKLMTFYHRKRYLDENKDTFQKILIQDANEFPIPSGLGEAKELVDHVENMHEWVRKREDLNLNLLEYLGIPSDELPSSKADGTIGDRHMPVSGVTDTPLAATTEEYTGLRIEDIEFKEDGEKLLLSVYISYTVDEDDSRETDPYNRLAESEYECYEAVAFVGLSETEKTLLREFIQIAVDKGGGFAGFRNGAGKTITPLERVKDLTLPDIDEVRTGLNQYMKIRDRDRELEEKINKTEQQIDEIIYELYGMTDEDIEIIEEAVTDG